MSKEQVRPRCSSGGEPVGEGELHSDPDFLSSSIAGFWRVGE